MNAAIIAYSKTKFRSLVYINTINCVPKKTIFADEESIEEMSYLSLPLQNE